MISRLNGNELQVPVCKEHRRFVFAGNRSFVLEEIVTKGHPVDIFAVPDSYLERNLQQSGRPYTVIESKEHLVSSLESMDIDIFIANGCPHILPVSRLSRRGGTFVNVHPGPLPDLRGMDPVPGALLFGRDSGAACHIMDDGIDTGPLISRVIIPNTKDLDAGLLYQIAFIAEREAFNIAYEREFRPESRAAGGAGGIYYTIGPDDLKIDFSEPVGMIIRRIRAFSNHSQGARFTVDGIEFRVFDAESVDNPYLMDRRQSYAQGEIVFRYENCLLVRLGRAYLKLKEIEGELSVLHPGNRLCTATEPAETTRVK